MNTLKRRASDKSFYGALPNRIKHVRRISEVSQAELAKAIAVGPSAVAQWEMPNGTAPTVNHLIHIAVFAGVSFEWLATGRGPVSLGEVEIPAVATNSFAADEVEERLLNAFRRVPQRKRVTFVCWMEDFF